MDDEFEDWCPGCGRIICVCPPDQWITPQADGMTLTDKLAGVIRQRYDESPPGKWPTEDSLAAFIIEHIEV